MKTRRTGTHHIRAIDPQSRAEVELVASRMRQTLVEVLGEEVGGNMYTMDWLGVDRPGPLSHTRTVEFAIHFLAPQT